MNKKGHPLSSKGLMDMMSDQFMMMTERVMGMGYRIAFKMIPWRPLDNDTKKYIASVLIRDGETNVQIREKINEMIRQLHDVIRKEGSTDE